MLHGENGTSARTPLRHVRFTWHGLVPILIMVNTSLRSQITKSLTGHQILQTVIQNTGCRWKITENRSGLHKWSVMVFPTNRKFCIQNKRGIKKETSLSYGSHLNLSRDPPFKQVWCWRHHKPWFGHIKEQCRTGSSSGWEQFQVLQHQAIQFYGTRTITVLIKNSATDYILSHLSPIPIFRTTHGAGKVCL